MHSDQRSWLILSAAAMLSARMWQRPSAIGTASGVRPDRTFWRPLFLGAQRHSANARTKQTWPRYSRHSECRVARRGSALLSTARQSGVGSGRGIVPAWLTARIVAQNASAAERFQVMHMHHPRLRHWCRFDHARGDREAMEQAKFEVLASLASRRAQTHVQNTVAFGRAA